MIKQHLYILLLLFFISCSERENVTSEQLAPLFPEAQKGKLNLADGYAINLLDGDSILPILNSHGDTVLTGKIYPIKGKTISLDSIEPTKELFVTEPIRVSSHRNIKQVQMEIKGQAVHKDSLKSFVIGVDTSSYVLTNSTEDTIVTNKLVPITPQVISFSQPKPVRALSPRFKDAAYNNMQYLDVDQGMLSSYIYSVFEDSRGRLWFGTFSGVSLYDGNSFTHFTEKEGLPNNIVRTIMEDDKGNLWFGTFGGGVCKYDGHCFLKYTEKEGLSNNYIYSIIQDKQGDMWFGTFGGGVCQLISKETKKGKEDHVVHYCAKEGLTDKYTYTLLEDGNGDIWVGSKTTGAYRMKLNKETHRVESIIRFSDDDVLLNNTIRTLLEDKDGNIWIGTHGGGVVKYDGEVFTPFTMESGLCSNHIMSIVEDIQGNLWFGSYGDGICKMTLSDESAPVFISYAEPEGLTDNYVFSILQDKSENLWFGTLGGGVCKLDEQSFSNVNENGGLVNNVVRSIIEDDKGDLWFGADGGGITKYDGDFYYQYSNEAGLPENTVRTLLKDSENNIWIGTIGAGLIKFNGESFEVFQTQNGISDNYVVSSLEDSKGNLWFGTAGHGVTKLIGNSNGGYKFVHYTDSEGFSNNIVLSIAESSNGDLWFGTEGGGLCQLSEKVEADGSIQEYVVNYTEKEGLPNNIIYSMIVDESENIWLGSDGGGVTKFDGEKFTYFTENEGLTNNYVWSILEDKDNNIWASTENGISCLLVNNGNSSDKIADPLIIVNFAKENGLKGLDFFANSNILDSENRAWWGSGKGLTMLDLNSYSLNEYPPRVQLNFIEINDKFIDFRKISDSTHSNLDSSISLNGTFENVRKFSNSPLNLELPYDLNHLTFHFSATDWAASHKVKYSYKIEGLNDSWSQPDDETKADYRNLPYGTYTFKVRAIGEVQIWSEPFEYQFTILPPWWHTWWAYCLYVLLLLLTIWTLIKVQTRRLKLRQEELESQVESATAELREKNALIEEEKVIIGQQKDEIEFAHGQLAEHHKEIADSINYAKRLQQAIFPSRKKLNQELKNGFIFFRPKDVVSGDFYWMEVKEDLILFAAADCTGHGVPGAMVSLVCNNALNRSVREYNCIDPGKILDKTREIVIEEFEKSSEQVKDGMDIALCSIKGNQLKYAGAHNPLWIIRNGKLIETKADKQPIGKFEKTTPYTTHTFTLQPNDTVYVFSDGYADQFGGEKGKKFKTTNFKKLLLGLQDKSMDHQKSRIEDAFENWRGENEQLDDVCVIGIRF